MMEEKEPVKVVTIVGGCGAFVPKKNNVALKIQGLGSCYGITFSSEEHNFAFHVTNPIPGLSKEEKKDFIRHLVRRYLKELPDIKTTSFLKINTLIFDENSQQYIDGITPNIPTYEQDDMRNLGGPPLNPEEFLEALQDAFKVEAEAYDIKISLDAYLNNQNSKYRKSRNNMVIDENGDVYRSADNNDPSVTYDVIKQHNSERKKFEKPGYKEILKNIKEKTEHMPQFKSDMTEEQKDQCLLFYNKEELQALTVPKTRLEGKISEPDKDYDSYYSNIGDHLIWQNGQKNNPTSTYSPLTSEQYSHHLLNKTTKSSQHWKHIELDLKTENSHNRDPSTNIPPIDDLQPIDYHEKSFIKSSAPQPVDTSHVGVLFQNQNQNQNQAHIVRVKDKPENCPKCLSCTVL